MVFCMWGILALRRRKQSGTCLKLETPRPVSPFASSEAARLPSSRAAVARAWRRLDFALALAAGRAVCRLLGVRRCRSCELWLNAFARRFCAQEARQCL